MKKILPINIDEFGTTVSGPYTWTNTTCTGAIESSVHCSSWASSSAGINGNNGVPGVTGCPWSDQGWEECSGTFPGTMRLYCFEQ